jgi:hypothetical protein
VSPLDEVVLMGLNVKVDVYTFRLYKGFEEVEHEIMK